MRKILLAIVLLTAVLAAVVVVRATRLSARPAEAAPPLAPVDLDPSAVARTLGGALQIPTISTMDPTQRDPAPFGELRTYLETHYPRVHARLDLELVAQHTLLFTWAGSEPSLDPLLLMAHHDVVPVEPGTEADWEQPPFSGAIADGFVWGRGALDDKASVITILEAVDHLLASDFQPRRTLLLAFGHDEEIGGEEGAAGVAQLLADRGIRPLLVLDEGGSVVEGIVPLVDRPVAVIGIAEKGYVSAELVVETDGGHSSTPPRESSLGILARAVGRVEQSPMPARIVPATEAFLEALAPEAPLPTRMVLANLWLFKPALLRVLSATPATNAVVRTTTAPTIFHAGIKDNVVPSRARAVVNHRILPGDSVASVIDHLRRAADDPRVRVEALPEQREPSTTSRIDSAPFALLAGTIRAAFPDAIVAPYLVLGGTDAKHFQDLSEHVYRFMPLVLRADDVKRAHGTNERVPVADLVRAVRFYVTLVQQAAG